MEQDRSFAAILAYCAKCDGSTVPDVMDLIIGTDPSCGVCGAWYSDAEADKLIAAHIEDRTERGLIPREE